MKKWQVNKKLKGRCNPCQLLHNVGKAASQKNRKGLYKIWRLVEGLMLKREKRRAGKLQIMQKLKRKKERVCETSNIWTKKEKKKKKFRCVFFKFLLI